MYVKCREMIGELQPGYFHPVDVLPTEKTNDKISLHVFLWNYITGQYEKKGESRMQNYCKCQGNSLSINNVQNFLTTVPKIL